MEKMKRGNLRSDELEKKSRKKKKKMRLLILAICLLIILAAIIVLALVENNKTYNAFEVTQTIELTNASGNSCIPYKSGILKMTRDGAETISADGKVLWNVSYNMKEPIGAVSGNYAVIADRGGTSLYIIDGAGTVNQISVLHNIEQVEIAAQGVTAVLTTNGEYNDIFIYSMESQGTEGYLFHFNTNAKEHGFPVEIALSANGKKLITSYMAVNEDSITSWVTFYSLSDYGKNLVNNVAGSISFDKTIVPEIEFLTNNLICVYSDSGFLVYQMDEVPTVYAKEELAGEVEKVFHNDSQLGFIMNSSNGEGNKKLLLYNYEGKKLVEKELGASYEKALLTNSLLVLYSNLSYGFYDLKGNLLFEGNFQKNVNYIIKTSQSDSLLCVSDLAMERIRLITTKED